MSYQLATVIGLQDRYYSNRKSVLATGTGTVGFTVPSEMTMGHTF